MRTRVTAAKWWSMVNDYIMIGYDEATAQSCVDIDFYCPEQEINE